MDRRLIERTIEVAKETGAFGPGPRRSALDSSPLWGAGRVEGYCQLNGFCTDGFSLRWCSFPFPSGLFASEEEEQAPSFPLS
jgi:hypothetical protein